MSTLNNQTLKIQNNLEHVVGLTDVTGFGLVGHLSEMLGPFSCEISFKSVSIIKGVPELVNGF